MAINPNSGSRDEDANDHAPGLAPGWAQNATLSIDNGSSDKLNPSSWHGGDQRHDEPQDLSRTTDGPTLHHERFRIGKKLGEGGMGIVYQAFDNQVIREVAIKVMKSSITGTARRRFEREFRSLASLHHPHCLKVHDFGELAGGPFFTMDLFEGKPITSLAGQSLEQTLKPLLQVTLALDYIHSNGIIHRDIKPSNILVRPAANTDGNQDFEAKVMDFGLAKYYGVKSSLSAEAGFVGTVAYCAPEQLNNDELDHRADLYCLGLVGYELLSGCYAFPEARLGGMRALMRAQLSDTPRPLAEISPEVPKSIADALTRYLRKTARKRPESAAMLRDAIAGYLKLSDETLYFTANASAARPVLSVTGFVCRTQELEAIEAAVRNCLSGTADLNLIAPGLILVIGEPGMGKSSLVREAERTSRSHGCQVYLGRCFDGNLSPFQPFVEILRQIIIDLRSEERREAQVLADDDMTETGGAGTPIEQRARFSAIVNDYAGEILRVAPDLRKYLPGEAYRQVDFGREADYIFRALSALFIELATLQPICLSLEDIQWADKSSLDLLRQLCISLAETRQQAGLAIPKLMIIASARTGHSHVEAVVAPLRGRHRVMELVLAPLSETETRELIALRLNSRPENLSDDLIARVNQLCSGNPFFISETIREWFEKNTITRDGTIWSLATLQADQSDLPQSVREAMRLRVEGLSPKTQLVLGAAAVIGAIVEIDLLREVLADLSELDILDALDDLVPRRVFRETGNIGKVEFVHDLLREFPYADLSPIRRRSLHRRVGELLEARRDKGQAVSPAVLAAHFRDAQLNDKAFTYELEAARSALDAYAYNNAITHLENALKLMPDGTEAATRYRLWDMLGFAFGSSGRPDDSISAYHQALKHAESRLARATVHHGIGEAYHRKSAYAEAIHHFSTSLTEVGFRPSKSLLGRLFDVWKTSIYFHFLPANMHLPDGGPDRSRRLSLAIENYGRLCQLTGRFGVFGFTLNSYKLAAFAKRSREPEAIAVGYTKIGLNCGMFSMHGLGHWFIKRAQKAAESCSRREVLAVTRAHFGCAKYFQGRLDEAENAIRESLAVLDKSGEWFGNFSHHVLRHLYTVRGDFRASLVESEYEIAIGTMHGDPELLAYGRYGKADSLCRLGNLGEALQLANLAVESLQVRNSLVIGIATGVLGLVRMQASDYTGAREALVTSRRAAYRKGFLVEFAGPTFPLLVESLVGPHWAEREAQLPMASLRRAESEARTARFVGSRYPNYLPHALRVSGRAAFAAGKTKDAVKFLERSIITAEKLGARYDLARALLDASCVIPEKSPEYRRLGLSILGELGAAVPEAERLTLDYV